MCGRSGTQRRTSEPERPLRVARDTTPWPGRRTSAGPRRHRAENLAEPVVCRRAAGAGRAYRLVVADEPRGRHLVARRRVAAGVAGATDRPVPEQLDSGRDVAGWRATRCCPDETGDVREATCGLEVGCNRSHDGRPFIEGNERGRGRNPGDPRSLAAPGGARRVARRPPTTSGRTHADADAVRQPVGGAVSRAPP